MLQVILDELVSPVIKHPSQSFNGMSKALVQLTNGAVTASALLAICPGYVDGSTALVSSSSQLVGQVSKSQLEPVLLCSALQIAAIECGPVNV